MFWEGRRGVHRGWGCVLWRGRNATALGPRNFLVPCGQVRKREEDKYELTGLFLGIVCVLLSGCIPEVIVICFFRSAFPSTGIEIKEIL